MSEKPVLCPTEQLSKAEQSEQLEQWRKSGDEAVYERLFTSLIRLAPVVIRGVLAQHPSIKVDIDELVVEIGVPTIQKCLEKFKFGHASEASLSWYVSVALRRATERWAFYYERGRTFSLDEAVNDGGDTWHSMHESPCEDSETLVIRADLRRTISGLCRAIALVTFDKKHQSEVLEQFFLSEAAPTKTEVSRALGDITCERVRQVSVGVYAAIREVFELHGEASLIKPSLYLLHQFFPTLRNGEMSKFQLAKLKEAGIVLTDDGFVDLTAAGDNRFNRAVFATEDGGYVSGFDMLKAKKVASVAEWFRVSAADPRGILMSNDSDFDEMESDSAEGRFERIRAVVSSFENMKKMEELFKLKVGDDGRWVVEPRIREFLQDWCLFPEEEGRNGLMRGGTYLLNYLYGKSNRRSKARMQRFFEDMFGGPANIDVRLGTRGGDTVPKLEKADLLPQLRRATNIKILESKVTVMDDGRLLLDFSRDTFRGVFLTINGQPMGIKAVLIQLGLLDVGSDYMESSERVQFYKLVFGDEKAITPRELMIESVRKILTDEFLSEHGIYKTDQGYIIKRGAEISLRRHQFIIGDSILQWRQVVSKALGIENKNQSIRKVLILLLGCDDVYIEEELR